MKAETKYKILFPILAICAGFALSILRLIFPSELESIFIIVASTTLFFTMFFWSFRSKYIETKDPNEFAQKVLRIMYGNLIYLIFVLVGIIIHSTIFFSISFITDITDLPLSEIEAMSGTYATLILFGYIMFNLFIINFLIQIFKWWKKVLLPHKVKDINVKSLKVLKNPSQICTN